MRGSSQPVWQCGHSSYVFGQHLHRLEDEPGGVCCAPGAVILDRPPFRASVACALPQVPGVIFCRDVCSAAECAQLILLAEGVGFEEDSRGRFCSSFTVDGELHRSLFGRIKEWVPRTAGGAEALDVRWTVERRAPGLPEFDTRFDLGRGCGTLTLFLNQAEGGEVRYWLPGGNHVDIPCEQGAALFHRDNSFRVQSAPVHSGHQHLLRCGLLCCPDTERPVTPCVQIVRSEHRDAGLSWANAHSTREETQARASGFAVRDSCGFAAADWDLVD